MESRRSSQTIKKEVARRAGAALKQCHFLYLLTSLLRKLTTVTSGGSKTDPGRAQRAPLHLRTYFVKMRRRLGIESATNLRADGTVGATTSQGFDTHPCRCHRAFPYARPGHASRSRNTSPTQLRNSGRNLGGAGSDNKVCAFPTATKNREKPSIQLEVSRTHCNDFNNPVRLWKYLKRVVFLRLCVYFRSDFLCEFPYRIRVTISQTKGDICLFTLSSLAARFTICFFSHATQRLCEDFKFEVFLEYKDEDGDEVRKEKKEEQEQERGGEGQCAQHRERTTCFHTDILNSNRLVSLYSLKAAAVFVLAVRP